MAPRSASMAQLNVRMDPTLKQAGEAQLTRLGITPSQFIRAVWTKIQLGEKAVDQLLHVLVQDPGVTELRSVQTAWETTRVYRTQRRALQSQIEELAGPPPEELSEEAWQELLFDEQTTREAERLVGHDL